MNLRTAALTMATLALCTAGQAALITNGGFETGNFNGWALTGNVNLGFSESVCASGSVINGTTCTSHDGTYAAALGPSGPAVDLYQNVATKAGADYTLSFFLRNENLKQTPSNSFSVSFGGKSIYSIANASTFSFTGITIPDLIGSSAITRLDVFAENVPGGFFLDDVSLNAVNAVPEPACLLLVTTALGVFGLMRRKRPAAIMPAPSSRVF